MARNGITKASRRQLARPTIGDGGYVLRVRSDDGWLRVEEL